MALKELSIRPSATSPAKPIGRGVDLNLRCTESRMLLICVCTACSEICDVCWAMCPRLWNRRDDAVVLNGPATVPLLEHVVVSLRTLPSELIVMEPVQVPVKLHVASSVPGTGEHWKCAPDGAEHVPELKPEEKIVETHALACAAAGASPNPSSNVMARPKTATVPREQNRNGRADLKSMFGPRQEPIDKLMEISNADYCKKATFATIPLPG